MDTPVHEATYDFEYDSADAASIVERSLRREIGEIDDDRSGVALERDGRTLTVRVEAADLVALRAATNTWLSLIDVAEGVRSAGAERSRARSV
ncbi:KEOPS complex subunit Pcc1 [Natronoarchaeum rubrum]|uniref:KEOPS complex subunit Pcc1 n=1 Tax=Natronoarchaeum rubrum TaxID=755311 RepID=UPI00211199E4|nr:KEOPS complex subunit Pcc1 [Natronoarchaeum rubrum]